MYNFVVVVVLFVFVLFFSFFMKQSVPLYFSFREEHGKRLKIRKIKCLILSRVYVVIWNFFVNFKVGILDFPCFCDLLCRISMLMLLSEFQDVTIIYMKMPPASRKLRFQLALNVLFAKFVFSFVVGVLCMPIMLHGICC